jgi:hypothetical protein
MKSFSFWALGLLAGAGIAEGAYIYDGVQDPLPPAIYSVPFQAGGISSFGDYIRFSSVDQPITAVNVTMATGAMNPGAMDPSGWLHEITLNFYQVNLSNPSSPQPGSLLLSTTEEFLVPWKPGDYAFAEMPFNIQYDFSALGLTLPEEIMYSISFNTETYGSTPIGVGGPYNSLNVGLNTSLPSVGTDIHRDAFLITDTFGGPDYWQSDTWDYSPAIQFAVPDMISPVPEPSTVFAGALTLSSLLYFGYRRLRLLKA